MTFITPPEQAWRMVAFFNETDDDSAATAGLKATNVNVLSFYILFSGFIKRPYPKQDISMGLACGTGAL